MKIKQHFGAPTTAEEGETQLALLRLLSVPLVGEGFDTGQTEKSADLVRYLGHPLGEIFSILRMKNLTMQGAWVLYRAKDSLMENVKEGLNDQDGADIMHIVITITLVINIVFLKHDFVTMPNNIV